MKTRNRIFVSVLVAGTVVALLSVVWLLREPSEEQRVKSLVHVPARNARLDDLHPDDPRFNYVVIEVTDPDAPHEQLRDWTLALHNRELPRTASIDKSLRQAIRNDDTFDCSLYPLDAFPWDELERATNVKWLLAGNYCGANELVPISKMTWLRGLVIGGDFHDANFSVLEDMINLAYLDLKGRLPEANEHRLPSMPNLEVLIMTVGAESKWSFPGDCHYPSLKVLDATSWDMTDDDVAALASGCPGLHFLNLSSNPRVTKESMPHLVSMKNLRMLYIGSTGLEKELIETKQLQRFESMIPKCRVAVGR